MNLLYLCHRIPYPPHTGDKVRSYHQVRHLARNHRIALACFADDRSDLRHVAALRDLCASVDVVYRPRRIAQLAGLRGLPTGRSLAVTAFRSGTLAARVAAAATRESFDAVIAFTAVMAPYGERVSVDARIVDFVDADSEKWRDFARRVPGPLSWLYGLEADRLRAFEIATARTWDHSIFVSEREASFVRPSVPDRPVTILSNGVDLEYFTPGAPGQGAATAEIVFTGAMDYLPNVDAVVHFSDAIFPRIRARVPAARFAIVGRDPAPAVRRLAERPGIAVTGTVPDIRDSMRGALVSVAPLRIARGVQNKILEAMAMGIPVVSTSDAFRGLGAARAEGVEVADDPAAFAEAVIRLLQDEAGRRARGAEARAYVERHHRWDLHGERLESLIVEHVAARRAGRPADAGKPA